MTEDLINMHEQLTAYPNVQFSLHLDEHQLSLHGDMPGCSLHWEISWKELELANSDIFDEKVKFIADSLEALHAKTR